MNRQVSAAVRGDASELPEAVHTLVEKETSALSLMMLMRLHPVMPKAKELLDFGTTDGLSFDALVFNSVMLGRLRSADYVSWMNALKK